MLVQCPHCKELVKLSSFDAEAGTLRFDCSACHRTVELSSGAETPAPAAPRAGPRKAPSVPPKSAAATEAAGTPPAAREPPPNAPPGLWEAWETLRRDWNSSKAHQLFVGVCGAAGSLPFAGNLYRQHLVEHPKDPMALQGRDRVLAQAMASVGSLDRNTRPEKEGLSPLLKVLLIGVCMMIFAVSLVSMAKSFKRIANPLGEVDSNAAVMPPEDEVEHVDLAAPPPPPPQP